MMKRSLAIALLTFIVRPCLASDYFGGSRDPLVFFGLGVGRTISSVENNSRTSRFEGWSPAVEAGFEMPWSANSGILASYEYAQAETTNKTSIAGLIENATAVNEAARIGLFYKGLALGGGVGRSELNIKQVSVTTGTSQNKLEGSTSLYFIRFYPNLKSSGRLSIEAEQRTGVLSEMKSTEMIFSVKYLFLLTF